MSFRCLSIGTALLLCLASGSPAEDGDAPNALSRLPRSRITAAFGSLVNEGLRQALQF